jgi:hypothetical protein
MSVSPALERLRQEDHEFQASSRSMSSMLSQKKKREKNQDNKNKINKNYFYAKSC